MIEQKTLPASGFYGLNIAPRLLEELDRLKFTVPTPIQHKAIPPACEGKDLVGIAQTGTGKTIAFAIPMLQRLAALPGRGLILLPTRELALQVNEVFRKFARAAGIQTSVLIGGESIGRQQQDLRKQPRILIATPGRLIDHIGQRTVKLSDINVLILDEADRMFDMGFAPQIEKILAGVPKDRQTMLFSATMPDDIMSLASRHMKLPLRLEVARSGTTAEGVEQELYVVASRTEKNELMGKLLDKHWGPVLLFMRTKHHAKRVARDLRDMGHNAAEIHSNRSLGQRKEALEGFKSGKYRVLVATDIAARGIDVTGIEVVINYDLPDEDENYVHRIGRTGRAGKTGHAISFATPDQAQMVRSIERLIRKPLRVSAHPDIKPSSLHGSGGGGAQPQRRPAQGGQQRSVQGGQQRPAQQQRRQPQKPQRRPGADAGQSRPDAGRNTGQSNNRPAAGRPAQRGDRDARPPARRDDRRDFRRSGGEGHRDVARPSTSGRVENSAYFPEDGRGMWNGQGGRGRGRGRDEQPRRPAGPAREEQPKAKAPWYDFFRKGKR
ncbi:MAG: ATP-dependent RNA helicase RhlE [Elusimicrobia bacterium]|nr:MAG: ATP-dependent RNA helicase RhlE [Elusimicrobiota bacterium]KAF0154766.1 MAG: ATP-dependent RNA helicase RhlE [Elusimicrobiota bacterium]